MFINVPKNSQLKINVVLEVTTAVMMYKSAYVTVYRKTGHNAACVNIEKRPIDFLKMYCFKPKEGNG